jgi:hypothetical protein
LLLLQRLFVKSWQNWQLCTPGQTCEKKQRKESKKFVFKVFCTMNPSMSNSMGQHMMVGPSVPNSHLMMNPNIDRGDSVVKITTIYSLVYDLLFPDKREGALLELRYGS